MGHKHTEAAVKIYFTRDYGIFKSILGNRDLAAGKINKIIKDIDNGLNMLKYCPIIVDDDMNVIDGQHRLFVAKKIKSPVWYVISSHINLVDIARINSNTEKWKPKDFLNCYIVQGNDHYLKLETFMIKHHISLSVAVQLLMYGGLNDGGIKTNPRNKFERGEFVLNHLDWAENLVSVAKRFKKYKGHLSRVFLIALNNLLKAGKCNLDDLVRNFNNSPDSLEKCRSVKDIMIALEAIYNFKKKERHLIF